MKGVFLLMIVYCIVACQKDNQVAKVYENRQKIFEVCNGYYGLSQYPGRGNFVLLRTYNDSNKRVTTYTFKHKNHSINSFSRTDIPSAELPPTQIHNTKPSVTTIYKVLFFRPFHY